MMQTGLQIVAALIHQPVLENISLVDVLDELFGELEPLDQSVDRLEVLFADRGDLDADAVLGLIDREAREGNPALHRGEDLDMVLVIVEDVGGGGDAEAAGADVDQRSADTDPAADPEDCLAAGRNANMESLVVHGRRSPVLDTHTLR